MVYGSRWLSGFIMAGGLALASAPASATVYTLKVDGTLATDQAFAYDQIDRTGLFTTAGQSLAGKTFSVVYTIDTSEPWSVTPPPPGATAYVYLSGINRYYSLGEAITASVRIGNVTVAGIGSGGSTDVAGTQSQASLANTVPDNIQISTGTSGITYVGSGGTYTGFNIRVNNTLSNSDQTAINLSSGGMFTPFEISYADVPYYFANGLVSFAGNGQLETYAYLRPSSASLEIAAVPEPASWAMMIGGFGMVGAAARRRRKHLQIA
jgi:hypothetical protein